MDHHDTDTVLRARLASPTKIARDHEKNISRQTTALSGCQRSDNIMVNKEGAATLKLRVTCRNSLHPSVNYISRQNAHTFSTSPKPLYSPTSYKRLLPQTMTDRRATRDTREHKCTKVVEYSDPRTQSALEALERIPDVVTGSLGYGARRWYCEPGTKTSGYPSDSEYLRNSEKRGAASCSVRPYCKDSISQGKQS